MGCSCVQMLCERPGPRPELLLMARSKQDMGSTEASGESISSDETTLVMDSVGEASVGVGDAGPCGTAGLVHQLEPQTEEAGAGSQKLF